MARGSPDGDDMAAGHRGGYLQQSQDVYRRTGKMVPDGRRSMVDRAAYMSFLESQLERVTASCKTVESYNSRIDTMQDAMAGAETRIANNTRLIKIAQSFGEQVEDDMKKFKQVYANKFQRMDESVSSALDVHQKMLDRVDALERFVDKSERNIQQVEERVAFSLSKHSLHTEEMVGAMEERVMLMLKGHKEEVQSSIDRAARETRELLSSVTEGRREELLERERFQQSLLEESRRQYDEWEALTKELRRRVDDLDARSLRASGEAISKADAAISRLQGDVQDIEARLAGEVRSAVTEIRSAEERLARGVDASVQPLSSTARDLEMVRRDVVRLDTERLKMKDLLLSKMTDIDRRMGMYGSERNVREGGRDSSGPAPDVGVLGGGSKTVRIDDGKGRVESTNTSKRLDTQLAAAQDDLRKRVDQGLDRVQQVLEKSSQNSQAHVSHSEAHQPQNLPGGRGGGRNSGADRLGAALIGLESGALHQHSSARDGHTEPRPSQREAHSSSLGRGVGDRHDHGSGMTSSTALSGGGRWLLNPEGIGSGIQAAMKNSGGAREVTAGGVRGMASARSPSPLSDTNDGGASMEERKERRRKRLKELYKELTSLEVEESSFRKH